MKRRMILTALAVAAVLATACTKETSTVATGEAIGFRPLVNKNANSRASLVDQTADLTSFFVAGGLEGASDIDFMQTAVWRSDGEWKYAPTKYFPTDGTAVNFYAYAPIKDVNMKTAGGPAELQHNGSNVLFGYTVPYDQSKSNTAVDLLVSSASAGSGQIEFDFYHALSGVTFSAINENPSTSELVYVISDIEISALDNEGEFTYTNPIPLPSPSAFPGQWDSQWTSDESYTYKPGLPASGVALMPNNVPSSFVNLLSANDIMMVLPQDVEPGTESGGIMDSEPGDWSTNSYVKVTFSLKDGEGIFIYPEGTFLFLPLPNPFSFKPGTLYDFQFRFSASKPIAFDVNVLKDWTPPVPPISIP